MPAMRRLPRGRRRLAAAAALALAGVAAGALVGAGLLAGPSSGQAQGSPIATEALPTLGLMGTIPLYWGESDNLGEILGGEIEPHWARTQLEQHYRLRPLAALTQEELAPLQLLLLAQPRALSPAENVALDGWVRGGGRLLLFADPLLTGESRFAIGDRRRPQDVILLSPILDRWGLELEFVDDQPAGAKVREIAGGAVPVNLPGRFAPSMQGGCTLEAAGLLADCIVGNGRAVVLADAALLDLDHPAPEAAPALAMLVERAFMSGDFAGKPLAPHRNDRQTSGIARVLDSKGPPAPSAANLAASVRNPP